MAKKAGRWNLPDYVPNKPKPSKPKPKPPVDPYPCAPTPKPEPKPIVTYHDITHHFGELTVNLTLPKVLPALVKGLLDLSLSHDSIIAALAALSKDNKMQFADVKAALTAINTATNSLATTVAGVVETEHTQLALIEELKAQIAAGSPISQEQLDELGADATARVAQLEAVQAQLEAIAADPADPLPDSGEV